MTDQEESKLSGFRSDVTPQGIGIEVHYNVEANSRGYNRKMSVGLFLSGPVDQQFETVTAMQEAAVRANDLAFQACNRLENKLRRMNGREIINPIDGAILGIDVPEPTYWQDPVDMNGDDLDDVPF